MFTAWYELDFKSDKYRFVLKGLIDAKFKSGKRGKKKTVSAPYKATFQM
jgi:hypothetical protein